MKMIEDRLKEYESFDAIRSDLSMVTREVLEKYVLKISEGAPWPKGHTVDSFIRHTLEKGPKELRTHFAIEPLVIGYSDERQAFGVATVWSYTPVRQP